VAKIRRNKERDREEQKKLAEMGWHCITVWECELTEQRVQNDAGISSAESRGKKTEGQLKPLTKREQTLDSLAFTLNHIWLQDHGAKTIPYPKLDEEDIQMPLAAEDRV
jgi:DNA mismatch endonuclease (patch repair protein)